MGSKKNLLHFVCRTAFIGGMKLDFSNVSFCPVISLPKEYEVFDFSNGYDPNRQHKYAYGIGKYNEKRPQMYTGELYNDRRDIHVGIDIMAPVNTKVHAFFEGEIFLFANNDRELDYGFTIITKHKINEQIIYALFGHLSKTSIDNIYIGQRFSAGDVIAYIGDKSENGGWNPHLHFQISVEEPKVCDMPGVVHDRDLQKSLTLYPDPRLILGSLY
jgi:murein DD-endopeptidase MepM/ murein hydrolase activator NlpD